MKKKNLSLKKLTLKKDTLTNLVAEQQFNIKGGLSWRQSSCPGCPTGLICPINPDTKPANTCVNTANCPASAIPNPCTGNPPGQTGC